MSDGIDGSLLYEHDISMNFGLCRWAQYINVLSDETTCDPGSIIAMAGMLGYKACGVEIWESDVAVKPVVHVGRGYGCGKVNSKGDEMFDQETGQRLDQFSDTQASANATAMEHFWYTLNSHTHAAPDGEAEYSAEAGAAAHAVGRVTCQPDGFNLDGERVEFTKGFFHKKRSDSITTEKQFYREAINKIADTQCITNDANENRPTGGLRIETSRFPTVLGETNMNPEGGFCDMPTQFLGTVKVGGLHRTPRWISITETSFKKKTPYNKNQPCKQMIPLYIPWENSRMGDLELPSSPALTAFQNIAWVGHDSTDSPWDSCEVGCAIPILENTLCDGESEDESASNYNRGLANYDYVAGYCDEGTVHDNIVAGSRQLCCSTGEVPDDDATCAELSGNGMHSKCSARNCKWANEGKVCSGTPSNAVDCSSAVARDCESAWDLHCLVPKHGDGGQCAADSKCSSGSCRGGRCCNVHGQTDGCEACDVSGNCLRCGEGTKLKGTVCVDACACSAGCEDCDCGTCKRCDDGHYLHADNGKCIPKQSAGADCTKDNMCVSERCNGGNCCDTSKINPGCIDCNFRGLCTACGDGYTLCGHHEGGHGQCYITQDAATTDFTCGTGGPGSDRPSSDGYNYCALANDCPCSRAGCYMDCTISHTCWVNGPAFERRGQDYNPFAGLATKTSTTTSTSTIPSTDDMCTDQCAGKRHRGKRRLP